MVDEDAGLRHEREKREKGQPEVPVAPKWPFWRRLDGYPALLIGVLLVATGWFGFGWGGELADRNPRVGLRWSLLGVLVILVGACIMGHGIITLLERA
jgi:hypothetical protein